MTTHSCPSCRCVKPYTPPPPPIATNSWAREAERATAKDAHGGGAR